MKKPKESYLYLGKDIIGEDIYLPCTPSTRAYALAPHDTVPVIRELLAKIFYTGFSPFMAPFFRRFRRETSLPTFRIPSNPMELSHFISKLNENAKKYLTHAELQAIYYHSDTSDVFFRESMKWLRDTNHFLSYSEQFSKFYKAYPNATKDILFTKLCLIIFNLSIEQLSLEGFDL